jgi:hypothetical protein
MINEIDLNGDGQICFEEFKTMMNNVIMKDKKKETSNLNLDNYIKNCNTFPNNKENNEIGFKARHDINDTFNENRAAVVRKTVIFTKNNGIKK